MQALSKHICAKGQDSICKQRYGHVGPHSQPSPKLWPIGSPNCWMGMAQVSEYLSMYKEIVAYVCVTLARDENSHEWSMLMKEYIVSN